MTQENDKKIFLKLGVGAVIFFTVIGGIYFYPKLSNRKTLNDSATISEEKGQKDDQFVVPGEERALSIVRNLPEVKEWLNLFSGPGGTSPTTGGKAIIELDSVEGGIYTIRAWESMPDHRATFNWYYVNVETGEVKDFFDEIK